MERIRSKEWNLLSFKCERGRDLISFNLPSPSLCPSSSYLSPSSFINSYYFLTRDKSVWQTYMYNERGKDANYGKEKNTLISFPANNSQEEGWNVRNNFHTLSFSSFAHTFQEEGKKGKNVFSKMRKMTIAFNINLTHLNSTFWTFPFLSPSANKLVSVARETRDDGFGTANHVTVNPGSTFQERIVTLKTISFIFWAVKIIAWPN